MPHCQECRTWRGRRPVRWCCLLVGILVLACAHTPQEAAAQSPARAPATGTYLVIRADDGGMSHSVDMAIQKVLASGLPVSVGVMFPCPWYQEIVAILKQHPGVSVGVHLTLNSEWRYYRWGPVIGREAAPSLVDENGYFFPSSEDLYRHQPDLAQVERELRAQIERALATGLRIDYLDYHMGTAIGDPGIRAVVERLGTEFGIALMGYNGDDRFNPQYDAEPSAKLDSLVTAVGRLTPGYHVLVMHLGLNTPELAALVDMNTGQPLANMSQNRQGELDALLTPAFRDAVRRSGVTLVTYRQLVDMARSAAQSSPAP
jgi:predicted glycoside hydrolase/deacetylase ChbG (UPF0249 family)